MNKFFLVIPLLLMLNGCQPTGRIYRQNDKGKVTIGRLPEEVVAMIKQHLFNITKQELKDTILIKYEYNNETCWSFLDMYKDSYVKARINHGAENHKRYMAARPKLSFYHFRQPGNNFNKLIELDKTILVDKDLVLTKLLFPEKSICGSSILILPEGYFILTKSDPHEDVLYYSSTTVNELLEEFIKERQKAL